VKVVVAPDKFKGSLSAVEAARAMAEGVMDSEPEAEVVVCPMADGGEGTVDAVVAATGAGVIETDVSGPLPGQRVKARWALLPVGLSQGAAGGMPSAMLSAGVKTAVIEMAQASGLWLIPPESRDPMVATTRGTGELISAALDAGCGQVVVGIGGSGTVDGGTGMAAALGYRFLDADGRELAPGGAALELIDSIEAGGSDRRIGDSCFLVASDVDNPLVGSSGAAAVYGPQKGASPEQVRTLDKGLLSLGGLIREELGVNVLDLPGAGAAGGLGAGLAAFCGARIVSGVELVAALVGLRERIAGADLVLTGEGSLDDQTAHGKTPAGVSSIAGEMGVPVVMVAGRISGAVERSLPPHVSTFCVLPGPVDQQEAMARAAELVRSGTSRLMRILKLRPS